MSLIVGEFAGDSFVDPLIAGERAQRKLNLLLEIAELAHPAQSVVEFVPETPVDLPLPLSDHVHSTTKPVSRKIRKKRDADSYPRGAQWRAEANCQFEPPATFFPSDGVGVEIAKRICETCVSKDPCLEYALATRTDHGVWGGTSERERRRIMKQRKLT